MRRLLRVPTRAYRTSAVGSQLIPMVNSLQSVFAQARVDFDLPQIVVVGAQSSGKSSVIESLVGAGDFLPRGRGIVTRVPLILQLVQSQTGFDETWGEFVHDSRFSGRRFSDLNVIRQTISEETDRIAGKNRGVSKEPLILRIHSPNSVPLTLVDTPGLTRIAVGGQPADVEAQIENMVSGFISNPNSIILAISPANVDIATSDSLRLARVHDPAGERTIGVLTKLDIVDKGSDVLDVLSGRIYPLRLGFVGVVGRSQSDIDAKKPLARALQDEQLFFAQSPQYQSVASVNGVNYLASRCNRLLVTHIKKVLPKLKSNIKEQSKELKRELVRIGEISAPTDSAQRSYLMLRLIEDFSNNFRAAIDGSGDRGDPDAAHSRTLNGGARIRHVFNEVFGKTLENIDPLAGLDDKDIVAAIRNAAGPKPSIFLPERAFEQLAKRSIKKLMIPAVDCVDRVHGELLRIMLEMDKQGGVVQFPFLTEKVVQAGQKMLSKTKAPTVALIKEIIEAEGCYINTSHSDFIGLQILTDPNKYKFSETGLQRQSAAPIRPVEQKGGFFSSIFGGNAQVETNAELSNRSMPDFATQSATEREKFQVSLLKTLVSSYFSVARKNVQDITVKLVWKNVVERSTKDLQRALMAELYKPEMFDILLRENPQVVTQRVVLRERLAALHEAKAVINLTEIREE